jgi:HSP20 family molecular chaperone IbpA
MFPWNMFPFNKDTKDSLQKMKPDEINNFVQDMINNALPANLRNMMNPQGMFNGFQNQNPTSQSTAIGPLQSSAFETHDHVYVRIPLKQEDWIRKLRIYHTSNQLIVEHIPEPDDKHTITLPAIVKKKGASANFKDNILEVKIPKNVDMQFSQIDVTEIM